MELLYVFAVLGIIVITILVWLRWGELKRVRKGHCGRPWKAIRRTTDSTNITVTCQVCNQRDTFSYPWNGIKNAHRFK